MTTRHFWLEWWLNSRSRGSSSASCWGSRRDSIRWQTLRAASCVGSSLHITTERERERERESSLSTIDLLLPQT